jgi:hypothetical protein
VNHESASAHAAAEKAPDQIFFGPLEIPARERLILFELFLYAVESGFVDDGGNGDGDPFLPRAPFASRLAIFLEREIGSLAFNPTTTGV